MLRADDLDAAMPSLGGNLIINLPEVTATSEIHHGSGRRASRGLRLHQHDGHASTTSIEVAQSRHIQCCKNRGGCCRV